MHHKSQLFKNPILTICVVFFTSIAFGQAAVPISNCVINNTPTSVYIVKPGNYPRGYGCNIEVLILTPGGQSANNITYASESDTCPVGGSTYNSFSLSKCDKGYLAGCQSDAFSLCSFKTTSSSTVFQQSKIVKVIHTPATNGFCYSGDKIPPAYTEYDIPNFKTSVSLTGYSNAIATKDAASYSAFGATYKTGSNQVDVSFSSASAAIDPATQVQDFGVGDITIPYIAQKPATALVNNPFIEDGTSEHTEIDTDSVTLTINMGCESSSIASAAFLNTYIREADTKVKLSSETIRVEWSCERSCCEIDVDQVLRYIP